MKNNSVMKCCICNNEKICQFITIDNEKYHLCCIKQLKENWNNLKKDIGYELLKLREPNEYNKGLCNAFKYINNEMQKLERGDA